MFWPTRLLSIIQRVLVGSKCPKLEALILTTTGKMGTIDDPLAVIDSRARVIGVNGLRVVDASSFAVLPVGTF